MNRNDARIRFDTYSQQSLHPSIVNPRSGRGATPRQLRRGTTLSPTPFAVPTTTINLGCGIWIEATSKVANTVQQSHPWMCDCQTSFTTTINGNQQCFTIWLFTSIHPHFRCRRGAARCKWKSSSHSVCWPNIENFSAARYCIAVTPSERRTMHQACEMQQRDAVSKCTKAEDHLMNRSSKVV